MGNLIPSVITSGDLNGDSIPDLVVGGTSGGIDQILVFLGNANGTFQNPITTVAGYGIGSIAVADFNLDGKADVALSNSDFSDVSLLLGNGDGTFQPQMQFSVNSMPQNQASGAITFADFDGNGSPDLAVANGDAITLMLSQGKNGSAALLSPTALGFGPEYVGQASAAQTAVLSNTASTALSIVSIGITGAQSSDFEQTNNCGATLAAGATCTISSTFTAQGMGTRMAAVTITDNAINSPQSIALAGTGQDFSVTSTAPSQSVTPGQTATYSLSVGPGGGFSQTVQFTCTGAPVQSSCSLSPTSVTLNGSAQPVTVTVTTVGPKAGLALPPIVPPSGMSYGLWMLCLGVFGIVCVLSLARGGHRSRRRWSYGLACVCVLGFGMTISGCGGSSGGGGGGGGGIQPGTYNLVVTGTFTSGSTTLTHTMPLTLVVQ